MHEQDWQEPLKFDWAGENGPPFTEEDFKNCVIRRILRDDFHPPWERIEYVRWTPQDPLTFRRNQRFKKYIPGKQKTPQYPRLSTLTKQEHVSGLKVLSAEYIVQPLDYPKPTPNDFETFAKLKEIYEKEQIEYRLWAKKCWVKGDCIRTLHPKPLLETVYDAQFDLKKNEINSLPISYRMLAQISLETGVDAFEFQPLKDLKSVDVTTLPSIEYPDLLDQDLSILQPFELPKPCRQHPSRFILPDESTVSELPLLEVHRKLAQFAMENGASFIASEKALECLLDTDRNWKLPVSVVKVICPESGVVKKVLVLGDEVCVKKECGAQRTHIAYRHLLRNTFTKSSEISESDLPTHQQAMKDPDRFHSRVANASSSSYEKNLQIDVSEQRRLSTKKAYVSNDFTNISNATSDADIPRCSSEPNRLTVANQVGTTTESQPEVSVPDGGDVRTLVAFGSACSVQNECGTIKSYNHLLGNTLTQSNSSTHQLATMKDPDQFHSREDNLSCSSDEEKLVMGVTQQRRRSTESAHESCDDFTTNSNATSDAEIPSYSSEPNRLTEAKQVGTTTESQPEVSVPDGGDVNVVVVFGSACSQNKCGTIKSYKHLLGNKLTQSNATTHQPATLKDHDWFHSRESNLSCSSDQEKLVRDVTEQRRRSTESAHESCDDFTTNSNATSDAEIPSCSSEPNRLAEVKQVGTTTESQPAVSVPDGGDVNTVVVFGSACSQNKCGTIKSYKHLLGNTLTQSNATTHQPATIKDHDWFHSRESNLSCSSDEEKLVMGVTEQRRRSTESAHESCDDVTTNGNATSDAEIPSCSSEPNRLTEAKQIDTTESQPAVFVPDGGDVNAVVVFGSACSVQNKCGTIKSYKHLLGNTLTLSNETSATKLPTHQMATSRHADRFHSKEAHENDSSDEEELKIDIIEQRRRSTESPYVSYDDTKNSNAPSNAEPSGCGSEPNELMDADEQRRRSTEGHQLSYDDTNNSIAPSDAELSGYDSEPNELMDADEQRRRSTESQHVSNDDTNDSNAPSNAELSGYDSEPNELIGVIEQRRRSTEVYHHSYDDTNLSNAPSDADLSSSESEPDRLIIDDGDQQSSKDLEFKTTVSVPVRQENYQNQAELYRKQNFSHLFGTDSDEDPSLEGSLQTRAEKEVAVPHEEQKQINFAAMYTEIEEATTDKISFDTTTLHEAINDIIEENPSSRKDIDDINCTCKGTGFEVPPPRSFKKWHVKKVASKRGFDLIIHSSHKVREGETEVILEPIVEWQPELGACKQSAGRLRALALAFMMRPMAKLMNVRVDYKTGNIIVIDKLDERRFMSWHGDKRSEIADRIYAVIDQLRYLKQGQYILTHDSNHGPHAMLYSAMAAAGLAGSSGHTLSLRPERDHLTESEEATLSKIPPEMSRALMPYHKAQGILPLAFTTDKNHVQENKKVIPPLAQPRIPPQAFQPGGAAARSKWRRKKRKMKMRTHH